MTPWQVPSYRRQLNQLSPLHNFRIKSQVLFRAIWCWFQQKVTPHRCCKVRLESIKWIISKKSDRYNNYSPPSQASVCCSCGIRGGSKTDSVVAGIINSIKPLKESLTSYKIKSRTAFFLIICNNQIYWASCAADSCVQGTGPYLCIGRQLKRNLHSNVSNVKEVGEAGTYTIDGEKQGFQIGELVRSYFE